MTRVPPSALTKEAIGKVLCEGTAVEDPKSALVTLAVQYIVEEGLEAAVRDLLGRDYYARGDGEGYRNGLSTRPLEKLRRRGALQCPRKCGA